MIYYNYTFYDQDEYLLEEFTVDYRLSMNELESIESYYLSHGIRSEFDIMELIYP